MKETILIIDDEAAICESLQFALEDNYYVHFALDGQTGLQKLKQESVSLVLLDLRLGLDSGLDLLKEIRRYDKEIVVIMMTAYGSIDSTIEAIKNGAYYYVTKPIKVNELKVLIEKGLEYKHLHTRMKQLEQEVDNKFGINGIIGNSRQMQEVFAMIEKVKDIDSNVLILGESGTGKELIAKAIHYQGRRKEYPIYSLNCAAIPKDLLESELFGYEKGAFTGANNRKRGYLELAHKGSLFLDEIGEMDLRLQAKLLRVLQEKEVMPLGSTTPVSVDVRFIAATNANLWEKVQKGEFRADLFYRLHVITIELPSLAQRKEDLPLLIHYFLQKKSVELEKPVKTLSEEATDILLQYNYPGNIRELENIIERAVALANGEVIEVADLPPYLMDNEHVSTEEPLVQVMLGDSLKKIEREVIIQTLYRTKSQKKTAKLLQISERAIRNKLKQYREEGFLPMQRWEE